MQCEAPSRNFFGIIFTTIVLTMILFGSSNYTNYRTVVDNWPEYRCQVEIMIFASLFGHNTLENMQYCLQAGFDSRAGFTVKPFYDLLGGFTMTLSTLLSSVNSIRLVFATLVGNISTVFTEFSQRMQALMYRIQYTSMRLQFLMKRVYATMYSLTFMGMSGMKAAENLTNTSMFKFMSSMSCFPPETIVAIENKGLIELKDVRIGDVFQGTTSRVTGVVSMLGDGQEMVDISGCHVSGTHYIWEGGWKYARDSVHAKKIAPWISDPARPLLSLNTSTHTLPIGGHIFSDYHETEEADAQTMRMVLDRLNGQKSSETSQPNYITGVALDTELRLADGTCIPAHSITLGTKLRHGTVVGRIVRECSTFSIYGGERFGSATAVWSVAKGMWERGVVDESTPAPCITFAVDSSATMETKAGTVFRDMFEIHDFDTEEVYKKYMEEFLVP